MTTVVTAVMAGLLLVVMILSLVRIDRIGERVERKLDCLCQKRGVYN